MNRRNFFKLIAGACALPLFGIFSKERRLPSLADWPKNSVVMWNPSGTIVWREALQIKKDRYDHW